MTPEEQTERAQLIASALAWIATETSADEARVARTRIEEEGLSSLRVGFARPLQFGTAGLRGEVGLGPGRMNESSVGKVSWALGKFLLGEAEKNSSSTPVVVMGFDARPTSASFAKCASEVLSGLGVRVLLASEAIATPLIAFATRFLGAGAGVVITASHNPRPDNGYKVYDDRGVQIVRPWDSEIAQLMEQCPPAGALTRDTVQIEELSAAVSDAYFEHVAKLSERWVPTLPEDGTLRLAYTPLHGVGGSAVERCLAALPIESVVVPEQGAPDGTFPTLEFPNPEEVGALDLLLEAASSEGCELALANDPDADRLACCLPLERASGRDSDELTRLSGDALGLIFADLCLRAATETKPCIVSTVVSTPALEELAMLRGGQVERTLTGFKWLCRAALEQPGFVFAYEEALGYCLAGAPDGVGVMDKDGIAALTVLSRLALREGGGLRLAKRLLALYRELGLWGSFGHSRRYGGDEAASEMEASMRRFRESGLPDLPGFSLVESRDFLQGYASRPWYLGRENLLSFELQRTHESEPVERIRILLRPSGTEPKLKAYFHLSSRLGADEQYLAATRHQSELASRLASAIFSS